MTLRYNIILLIMKINGSNEVEIDMNCNCNDDEHMLDCPMFLSSLGLVITYDNGIAVVDIDREFERGTDG